MKSVPPLPSSLPDPVPDCPRFSMGAKVYHLAQPSTLGIVTGVCFYPGGFFYRVSWGPQSTDEHYECELTGDPQYSIS
jgi:hypothetical protein